MFRDKSSSSSYIEMPRNTRYVSPALQAAVDANLNRAVRMLPPEDIIGINLAIHGKVVDFNDDTDVKLAQAADAIEAQQKENAALIEQLKALKRE